MFVLYSLELECRMRKFDVNFRANINRRWKRKSFSSFIFSQQNSRTFVDGGWNFSSSEWKSFQIQLVRIKLIKKNEFKKFRIFSSFISSFACCWKLFFFTNSDFSYSATMNLKGINNFIYGNAADSFKNKINP